MPMPRRSAVSSALFPTSLLRFVAQRQVLFAALVLLIVGITTYAVHAAIPLSTSVAVVQNFDGIGTAGAATLPADFRVDKTTVVRTVGTFAAAGTLTQFA